MFKSIEENTTAEIVVKKSKFIATLYYVRSEEEAQDIIKGLLNEIDFDLIIVIDALASSKIERVNKTLNQISDVVDQTKTFYNCEDADNYRNKFNSFRTNFKVVNQNLISYAEDLIKLKNRYQNMSDEMTQTINKAIANIEVPNNKW